MPGSLITDFGADPAARQRHSRAVKAGQMRRIHPGIYTADLTTPIERLVHRHALDIAAASFPGAVLSDRSAVELLPAKTGGGRSVLFLTRPGARHRLAFHGLEIRVSDGPGPIQGDYPHMGLFRASESRRLLENLSPSRDRSGVARTLGQEAVERLLDGRCTQEGEEHLNRIRDLARIIAPALGREREFELLDGIIGALLGTRTVKLLSQVSRARAAGLPYDTDCQQRLLDLKEHLESVALPEVRDTSVLPQARLPLCFIESYFSNYIEGTRFAVRDAQRIVFEDWIPPQRPKDGRDVTATYGQLAELGRRAPSSLSYHELRDELRSRHEHLMAARPDVGPGKFKVDPNYAGATVFAHPDLVEGTLKIGCDILADVEHPFARAVFLHFLLTDVHPFADGNGRLSRIMMTKELVNAGLSRIVIPNVYREDYLGILRLLSRDGDPAAFVRGLTFCQRATAAATAYGVGEAVEVWASMMAFQEASDVDARLRMPDPSAEIEWRDGIPGPKHYWANKDAPQSGFRL